MKLRLKSIFSSSDLDTDSARPVCAHPDCENKMPARFLSSARAGVTVGELWYCSMDCFTLAAHGILDSLSAAEVVELPRNPRLSLGLALLMKGYLTTEQFQHAMNRNEAEGVSFESTVIEQRWVTEKQLAAARAAQWGYPVLGQDLSGHTVVADLPPTLFRACSATPLYYSGERLVLGFIHRVDHSLLQAIEKITGCRAEPCFITPTQLARQLDRMTGPPRYEQILVESPGAVAQMVRTLRDFAVQIGATEGEFTRCHSFLWSRLAGDRETVDVLFDLKNAAAAFPDESSLELAGMNTGVITRAFARRVHQQR